MDWVAILAGGSGTRFWPKSREKKPKQFLSFGEGPSLLAQTLARTKLVAPPERTLVITSAAGCIGPRRRIGSWRGIHGKRLIGGRRT